MYAKKFIPPAADAEIDAMAELAGDDIAQLVQLTELFSHSMIKKFEKI